MEVNAVSLDTNAYTDHAIDVPEIVERVEEAEGVFVSSIVLGELFMGFEKGVMVLSL